MYQIKKLHTTKANKKHCFYGAIDEICGLVAIIESYESHVFAVTIIDKQVSLKYLEETKNFLNEGLTKGIIK